MNLNDIRNLMDKRAVRAALFAECVRALCAARNRVNKLANKVPALVLSVNVAIDGAIIALASNDDLMAMHTLQVCSLTIARAMDDIQSTNALYDTIDDEVFWPVFEVLTMLKNGADAHTLEMLALMDN